MALERVEIDDAKSMTIWFNDLGMVPCISFLVGGGEFLGCALGLKEVVQ